MLVLTRKYQEKIRIGNNITITVLRMKGKAVRLGIEAPPEVPVIRGELSFNGNAAETSDDASAALVVEGDADCEERPRTGRTFGRMAGMETPWPMTSRTEREPVATVEFTRVPRESVARLLPRMATAEVPQRAASSQNGRG